MLPHALQELSGLVTDIADRELPPRFNCRRGERKSDGSLVTEADLVMQEELAGALRRQWPDTAVLGEEMSADEQLAALQRTVDGVWCIDPLDGTSNFAAGVPCYAVSVALVRQGEPRLAVVYDPNRKECFAASPGQGAWLNGERLGACRLATPLREAMALIDLKRLPAALASRLAAAPPYKSQRNFGSVALEWCWLAAGRCHVYLHGRQQLWDYAAGCLILTEAGGRAVTLAGEPVFAPTLDPRSAAAALDSALFEEWKTWLNIPEDATRR
jgi:myo-inositol-1(or 4)-monophosphatase